MKTPKQIMKKAGMASQGNTADIFHCVDCDELFFDLAHLKPKRCHVCRKKWLYEQTGMTPPDPRHGSVPHSQA